jgi:hypothetical protein
VQGGIHQRRGGSDEQKAAFKQAETHFLTLVQALFDFHSTTPPLELDSRVWDLIWDWYRIDPASARDWIGRCFAAEEWNPLDAVAWLVTTSTIEGILRPRARLRGIDFQAVDALIGLDFLYRDLADQLSTSTAPLWDENDFIDVRSNHALHGSVRSLSQAPKHVREPTSTSRDARGDAAHSAHPVGRGD